MVTEPHGRPHFAEWVWLAERTSADLPSKSQISTAFGPSAEGNTSEGGTVPRVLVVGGGYAGCYTAWHAFAAKRRGLIGEAVLTA